MFQQIHLDQVGFLPNRQLRDSVRKVRNIIHYIQDRRLVILLYFIDVEKEFDHVDRAYLHEVLRRMGFGQSFLSWISIVYSTQEAEIFLEGYKIFSSI